MKTKLLIYGITGDLSRRKLLPALDKIITTGDFDNLSIIGVSRREVDVATLLKDSAVTPDNLANKISIHSMDLAEPADYVTLKDFIDLKSDEQLIVYLSVPPRAATQIVDFMGEAGITTPNVKLLFEKPFGVDLESAQEVISRTAKYFEEAQIYRIDHYLAKEMAQNIVAVRGSNALFSHVWNKQSIERIEVTAAEKIGIESRAQFYEQTGALRDVVQGHLLQLLALTLMDIPDNFDWNQLPELRQDALNLINIANPQSAFRAQYDTYKNEVENQKTQTETFASVELSSRDPRWQGVPLVLTTGKALDEKKTEVRVCFRSNHDAKSNEFVFRIQPNEGVELELYTKIPGYDRKFTTQKLQFSYPLDAELPDAYEQVLVDAIESRKSLFTSSEEVVRSWRILQPVLSAWEFDDTPITLYKTGDAISSILA